MSDRKKELAQIHIAKKELGLSDDDYRTMLWTIARVESAGKLDRYGRRRVLQHLRTRGWKPFGRRKMSGPPAVIVALWLDLHRLGGVRNKSDRALRKFVQRILPDDDIPDDIQWLDNDQATRVIEVLKKWRDRLERADGTPPKSA